MSKIGNAAPPQLAEIRMLETTEKSRDFAAFQINTEGQIPILSVFGGAEAVTDFTDTDRRYAYFKQLDIAGFKQLLFDVNSVCREEHIQDYEDGKLPMLITPSAADKEPLMTETLQAAVAILHDVNIEPKEALQRAALVLGGGLVLVHPFNDGNGRTSRLVSYVMHEGLADSATDNAKHLQLLAGENGMREFFVTPNPVLDYDLSGRIEPNDDAQDDAARKVRAFLAIMGGNDVPLSVPAKTNQFINGKNVVTHYPAGTIGFREFYELSLRAYSALLSQ